MRQLDDATFRVETTATSRRVFIEASTGEEFLVELSFESAATLVVGLTTEPPTPAPVPEPETPETPVADTTEPPTPDAPVIPATPHQE